MSYFFQLIILLISFSSFSIELEQEQLPVPPYYEKTRSFTFSFVERQPEVPLFLKERIKELELKSRITWKAFDSLSYAFELVYLTDFTHALNYFSRVNTDTVAHPTTLHLLQLTYLKTNRYENLKQSIKNGPDSPAVKEIRLRMVEVREMNMNNSWDTNENVVFPLLRDSSNFEYKKTQKKFYKYLVPRAEDFKKALIYDALYTDDTDKILSQAFEEYGDFLKEHFYLTNAYMAYAISRHYDKRNFSTAKKLKEIKTAMSEANFLLPSIRENFVKASSDRYLFKEIAETNLDSLSKTKIKSLTLEEIAELDSKKQPDYLPWVNYEILLMSILFLILLIVVVFIRTKK